eukprot:30466-Pelagococcus_subviridis.AAC.3
MSSQSTLGRRARRAACYLGGTVSTREARARRRERSSTATRARTRERGGIARATDAGTSIPPAPRGTASASDPRRARGRVVIY